MSSNILYSNQTSLPEIPHGYYNRRNLNRLLEEAIEHPLVTVTAGAGYGKTQAVSAFLHNAGYPFVWLQLSSLDNLTTRFWENFVYAVAIQNPYIAGRLASAGFPYTEAQFDDFLHRLADAISEIGRVVFIFDDFHLIEEVNITRFFENFLNARLKALSIILISRTKVILNIPGKLTNKLLVKITEEELRFSIEELDEYFKEQKIHVSTKILKDIYIKTEGWIAALYLIGLSYKRNRTIIDNINSNNTFPYNAITSNAVTNNAIAIAIANQQIFELIDEEIFSGYTKEIQNILVELSVLGDFSLELLKELVDINIILEISKTNTFIYFDPVTKNYRFHNLFSEFLSEKLKYLQDDKINDTYLKIAEWYYKKDFKVDALTYFEKCRKYNKIYDILSHYEIDIPAEEANLFLNIIERIPVEFLERHPLLHVIHARLLLNNGHIEEAACEFSRIAEVFSELPNTLENRAVLGEVYIFQAMISLLAKDLNFAKLYKMADENLPNGSSLVDNSLYILNGNISITIESPAAGEVDKYVEAITLAVPYASKVMHGCLYGVDYLVKAEAAYYMGDMNQAESNAFKAIYMAWQKGQNDIVCSAYFILIRLSIAAGNYKKASGFLKELKEKIEKPDSTDCLTMMDIFKGWYYVKLGDTRKVADWIKSEERSSRMISPNSTCNDWFVRAYYLLRKEAYYELPAYIEYLEEIYNRKGFLISRLETQILKSIAAYKNGDVKLSINALWEAYNLSYANSLIMHFVEQGSNIRTVIEAALKSKEHTIPEEWLVSIHGKANTYAKKLNAVTGEYNESIGIIKDKGSGLTNREKEILRHLCQGLKRDEIAKTLYISSSTVKSSVQNIYNKLGAGNKADAVRIAMQLGLNC